MHSYTPPANSILDGPVTNLLSIRTILIEVFSIAYAKREEKRPEIDFKFAAFIDCFRSDSAASIAAKGLIQPVEKNLHYRVLSYGSATVFT